MDQQKIDRLVAAQRAGFAAGGRKRTLILRVQLAMGAVAAASIWLDTPLAGYLLAGAAAALAVVWQCLNFQYVTIRTNADKVRRATVIAAGLGVDIAPTEWREIFSSSQLSEAEIAAHVDETYFASKAPPGPLRMAQMLEESAYWTKSMASYAAKEMWLLFSLVTLAIIVAVALSIMLVSRPEAMVLARLVSIVLITLMANEFLGAAIAYTQVAIGLPAIEQRLAANQKTGCDQPELHLIFGDYNNMVEAMPVFPAGLYPRHSVDLNRRFQEWGSTTPQIPDARR